MNLPLQITFRHMDSSPAVEARVRDEAAKLERFFDRITSCRVVIEAPHRHHQQGRGYQISIDIGVPGREIVVKHEPSLHASLAQSETGEWEKSLEAHPEHKDIYVAIRDAFAAARRQLEDYARILRGDVKRSRSREESSGSEP